MLWFRTLLVPIAGLSNEELWHPSRMQENVRGGRDPGSLPLRPRAMVCQPSGLNPKHDMFTCRADVFTYRAKP